MKNNIPIIYWIVGAIPFLIIFLLLVIPKTHKDYPTTEVEDFGQIEIDSTDTTTSLEESSSSASVEEMSTSPEQVEQPLPPVLYYGYTLEEITYLEKCVQAEAGDQGYLGKCYVVDVILNRIDSDDFPNTITEVINQKNQFAVVANNSINTVTVDEETKRAVQDELKCRTNTEILFFRTKHYHKFGTPLFQHKDHYFSK